MGPRDEALGVGAGHRAVIQPAFLSALEVAKLPDGQWCLLAPDHIVHDGVSRRWPDPKLLRDLEEPHAVGILASQLPHFLLGHLVRPTITGLYRTTCPSAVLGRVQAIVVDPIKRASRRARGHVRDEGADVMPALAHGDSASTVSGILRELRVVAAGHHCLPCPVERMGATEAPGQPVLRWMKPHHQRIAHSLPAPVVRPAPAALDLPDPITSENGTGCIHE